MKDPEKLLNENEVAFPQLRLNVQEQVWIIFHAEHVFKIQKSQRLSSWR
jgi:hypothetical protein